MNNRFILYVAFLLVLPNLSLADQLRVVRVTDGDTIKAVADHMEIIVRLVGIDAPEKSRKKSEPGQPFSQKGHKISYSISPKLNLCYFLGYRNSPLRKT